MNDKLRAKAEKVKLLHEEALLRSKEGSFAYKLAARSLDSHLDELSQLEAASVISPAFEMLDFRIKAHGLKTGSAPLDLVENVTSNVRKMLGFAALRLIRGGIDRKRIPQDLYRELDLRLVGLLPGSSRFIISAASERDLLDDGLSKGAIERVFAVLDTFGKGEEFLSAVTTLGPSSAKHMREFLKVLKKNSAEADFTWKYSGDEMQRWQGSKEAIDSVTEALEVTEITDQERISLSGKIELLSKRERMELRVDEGTLIKILYPKSILAKVSELHLGQEVSLYCQVTETENPLTNESSIYYELLEIKS